MGECARPERDGHVSVLMTVVQQRGRPKSQEQEGLMGCPRSLDRWGRIIAYRSKELGLRKEGWLFWHHNRKQVGTKWANLWFWHQDAVRVIFYVPWEVEGHLVICTGRKGREGARG